METASKSTFRILHLEDSQNDCELVRQLLAFAPKSEAGFTSTDINRHVRDIASMPKPALSQNISFNLQLEKELPEIHADPRQVERAPDNPKSVEGTETVLIVDDEPDVRCFLEIMLKSHGYRVLPAGDAEAALEMLPLPAGEIGLLLSDVGLPTIDGFELSRRARQIQPRLKTILCSGYTDGRLKARMVEQGIDCFIPKPYDMNELLRTIRAVLDKEKRK
jgi:CheY-like chemotaxis protein